MSRTDSVDTAEGVKNSGAATKAFFTHWRGRMSCSSANPFPFEPATAALLIAMPSSAATPNLESSGVGAAVDQEILSGNVPRLRPADKSAERPELLRIAETPRRVLVLPAPPLRLERSPRFLRLKPEIGLKAVGRKGPRQQVVDGHIGMRHLPGQAGDEAGESGSRAVRKSERRNRHLHRARGDIHDAPE